MTTRPPLLIDPEHGPELFAGDFGVIEGHGATWVVLRLVKALIDGGDWYGLTVTKVPFVRLVTSDHRADVLERLRLLGWDEVPNNVHISIERGGWELLTFVPHGVTIFDNFAKLRPLCDEEIGREWLTDVRMRTECGGNTVLVVLGQETEERFPQISACAEWYAGILYDYEGDDLVRPTLRRHTSNGPHVVETGGWRFAPLRWTRTKGLVLDGDADTERERPSKVLPFPAWARRAPQTRGNS